MLFLFGWRERVRFFSAGRITLLAELTPNKLTETRKAMKIKLGAAIFD